MLTVEKIETLIEYAELDGTEWGEKINALLAVHAMRNTLEDALVRELEKELEEEHDAIVDQYEIITTTTTHTTTSKSLERRD
jgi:hypothetical protein